MVVLNPHRVKLRGVEREHCIAEALVGRLISCPLPLGSIAMRVEHRQRNVVKERPEHIVRKAIVVVLAHRTVGAESIRPDDSC
eukprot:scaffold88906_cov30-Tisochrysis_lutea.AAC.8